MAGDGVYDSAVPKSAATSSEDNNKEEHDEDATGMNDDHHHHHVGGAPPVQVVVKQQQQAQVSFSNHLLPSPPPNDDNNNNSQPAEEGVAISSSGVASNNLMLAPMPLIVAHGDDGPHHLQHPGSSVASLPSPMSSHASQCGSEEESIAEMDYHSESSNVTHEFPPKVSSSATGRKSPQQQLASGSSPNEVTYTGSSNNAPPPEDTRRGPTTTSANADTAANRTSRTAARVGATVTATATSTPSVHAAAKYDNESSVLGEEDIVEQQAHNHCPTSLPKFRDVNQCVWTASHAANSPSEDRSACLVNILLQPLPPNIDSETQLPPLEADYRSLIRLNFWSVIDGHGGGLVATYASEVLLPHLCASVSRALGCAIVDRGVCIVNGQLRDANALDFDGLIRTDEDHPYPNDNDHHRRNRNNRHNHDHNLRNPHSIQYRSPTEHAANQHPHHRHHHHEHPSQQDETSTQRRRHGQLNTSTAAAATTTTATPSIASNTSKSNDEEHHDASSMTTTTKASPAARNTTVDDHVDDASSVKTSVKTAVSHGDAHALRGTHGTAEVAAITNAISESFLAVDEGWINSIDPIATRQTSCEPNGRWNSGACALVVFTIQRLDWTGVRGSNAPDDDDDDDDDREKESRTESNKKHSNTLQNQDAARRRMLDCTNAATGGTSGTRKPQHPQQPHATAEGGERRTSSSMSTVSTTSSLTTEEAVHNNTSGLESEITETEEEYEFEHDSSSCGDLPKRGGTRRRRRKRHYHSSKKLPTKVTKSTNIITPPGGCACHCYRAHDAMLYTAHVGDCRAVLLGSAPPRTIKVREPPPGTNGPHTSPSAPQSPSLSSAEHPLDHHHHHHHPLRHHLQQQQRLPDTTDDESSHHSSDETECLSSSDHDADSSEDEDARKILSTSSKEASIVTSSTATTTSSSSTSSSSYVKKIPPRRVTRRTRRRNVDLAQGPYRPLPPLENGELKNMFEEDGFGKFAVSNDNINKDPSDASSTSEDSCELVPLVHLPPVTRPIDLTTDHSAYNQAEVSAVLRRCNNAPRAISAGVGGRIKRVAGSLAVTRALGDAYLKTPKLSFKPYKSHAPYISASPEVNCRPLVKDGDKVLVLATDGVWERSRGEDLLRWVRTFYAERTAAAERRAKCDEKHTDCTAVPAGVGTKGCETESAMADSKPEAGRKRPAPGSPLSACQPPTKRERRRQRNRVQFNVADVIVRRVLNRVRRARNISSLQGLINLPPGRARRSKHDDITASVIDLSAFVS